MNVRELSQADVERMNYDGILASLCPACGILLLKDIDSAGKPCKNCGEADMIEVRVKGLER